MKKIIFVLVAIMLMVPMAHAEEMLSLSGQVRVWAVRVDNYNDPFDSDTDDDEHYFTQRFRLQPKITVAEGVYAHLRFDFAEDDWGSDNWTGVRYNESSELQVDRAYLEVNKEKYFIKAGQHLQTTGNCIAIDNNGTGLTLGLKFNPVTVTLLYSKMDENGSNRDNRVATIGGTTMNVNDEDMYGINVGFAKDKFAGNLFYATLIDKGFAENEDTKSVIGLQGNASLGKVDVNAELNYFFGDDGNTTGTGKVDYIGTQLFLDARVNLEKAMVGGAILYAMGTDKADEAQVSFLTDWADFAPFSFGILDYTDWCGVQDGLGYDSFDLGGNAGVMAITVYGEGKVANMVILRGQLAYAAPEEDDSTNIDSIILINAGAEYEFATGTALMASANYIIPSMEGSAPDDAALGLFAGLRLNF